VIAGLQTQVQRASLLATGEPIAFEQSKDRLLLHGLPETSPDILAGVAGIKYAPQDESIPTCVMPLDGRRINNSPGKVPIIEPEPPARPVPPITTAAITSNSNRRSCRALWSVLYSALSQT
jgi:hypothetical protein